MGIAKGAYSLLCDLKKLKPELGGAVLQLGRQRSFVTETQQENILSGFGLSYLKTSSQTNGDEDEFGDRKLFQSLGFECVDSLDNNDFEDATYIHDLNIPVPECLAGKYDCVFDGGTIEHIFHLPQVLGNIHALLKDGGYVIHGSPSSNHVDHGFYMFSPTLFYDYYSANGYKIVKSYLFEYEAAHDTKPWLVYDYTPGTIDHLSFGGWDGKKLLGIWFVAQKLSNSSCNVIPQQDYYRRAWGDKINAVSAMVKVKSAKPSLATRLRDKAANLFKKSKPPARPSVIAKY